MTDTLLSYLDKFPAVKVLSLGDVMLDRYIHGAVERISPEAPIPVLHINRESEMLGGTGNVTLNLRALEVQAICAGIVGIDEAARTIRRLIQDSDAEDCLVDEANRPTTVKTRFVTGAQQMLRADRETTATLSKATEAMLLQRLVPFIDKADAIVLSDYAKGALSESLIQAVIAAARAKKIPVIVDPKFLDYQRYAGASVLKPNRRELAHATGMAVDTDAEIEEAARRLIDIAKVETVIATRSEKGLSIVSRDTAAVHLRTEAHEVFDVSGAGDTVAATIAAALGAGASIIDAARLANYAAGIVVGKVGTAPVRLSELRVAIAHQTATPLLGKIHTLPEVLEQVARWRARGNKIGFTNGCFDLLHPGHISLLAQARQECDCLIVGLNSDDSVKRLKGQTRPVQDETARARVLSAIGDVDSVVIFPEDTPLSLIEQIRPDLLVKGSDYSVAEVVGADIVQSYGGKILLAEIQAGHSTTATIHKLRS